MSLTLSQLRTLQTEMLQTDLDNFAGQVPSTSDQNIQLNWALRFISLRLVMIGYAAFALTSGQVQYNIRDTSVNDVVSQEIIVPFSVTINNVALRDRYSRAVGFWSIHELENQYPGFRNASSGAPILACWLGNNGGSNLLLYPAPNSGAVSGGESYITGQVQAPLLVNDSDIPQIPDDCMEAVAALAAIYASTPAVTASEAYQKLSQMSQYTDVIEYYRQMNLQVARQYIGNSTLYNFITEEPNANPSPTQTASS